MNPLVDRALKLHQDAENAKQEAITKLLEDRKTISDQLKALGYIEGQKPPKKAEQKPRDPDKKCGVCGAPDHDGRFHRSDKKEPPPPPAPKPPVK